MSVRSDTGPWGIVPRALFHSDVSTTAVAVYALLSSYADRNSDDGWSAARKDLSTEAGISVDTFDRCVKALKDAGWLTVEPNVDDRGDQTWNRYIVHTVPRGGRVDAARSGHGRVDPAAPVRPQYTDPETDPVTDKNPPTPQRGEVEGVEEVDGWFELFWTCYPNKKAKPQARVAYRRALKKASARQIREGLEAWLLYWAARNEPQFIPYPQKWLNQERWNDDPGPVNGAQPKMSTGMQAVRRAWDRRQASGQ